MNRQLNKEAIVAGIDHETSMRRKAVIIGKLRRGEIREQRQEKKGLTGGGRNYFGCRGLTGRTVVSEQWTVVSRPGRQDRAGNWMDRGKCPVRVRSPYDAGIYFAMPTCRD